VGAGTVFTLYFPAAKLAHKPEPEAPEAHEVMVAES
jgi:hypothetical protein